MSANFYPHNPPKLRSPLLGGPVQDRKEKQKGKVTYFNLQEENLESIDDTLDKTLFSNNNPQSKQFQKQITKNTSYVFNIQKINTVETVFKIASAFVSAIGGTFCLLQLISIIRIIQTGSYSVGSNLLLLTTALVLTIVANVICIGFIHMVKATRHIYMNLDNQSNKLNHIFSILTRV